MAGSPIKTLTGNRQRQRTRRALLSAGEQLFASRSVEGVTIDQIVDAADVAKGSFYNHFADKESFADEVFGLIQGDIEFHVFTANQDVSDGAARTVRGLCTAIRYARLHPDRLMAVLSQTRTTLASDPLNAGLAADIRQGIEQGRMRGIDVGTGLIAAIGLTRAAVSHAMSADTDRAVRLLGADMSAITLRALGVDHDAARAIGSQAANDILGKDEE